MTENYDLVFECELSLAMVNAGYESINEIIVNRVHHILTSYEYKEDPRIFKIMKEYEKTISLYGYNVHVGHVGNFLEMDEVMDIYRKLKFYNNNNNRCKDFMYIKTVQRALILTKVNKNISNKYIDYINRWLSKLSKLRE
jgi:hypothetical protein